MSKKKVVGGTGITAGGDVSIGDVSGQVAIGDNIVQRVPPRFVRKVLIRQ